MPGPRPASLALTQSLTHLAKADEQLLRIIEYTQHVSEMRERKSNHMKHPLQSGWYFQDILICLNAETLYKLLVEEFLGTTPSDMSHEQDNLSILIAMMQYTIKNPGESIFTLPESGEFKYHVSDISYQILRRFPSYTSQTPRDILRKMDELKAETTTFVLDHDHKDGAGPWQYLIIVMMKRKLVRNSAVNDKKAVTIQQAVTDVYTESMQSIKNVCNTALHSVDTNAGKPYEEILTILNANQTPNEIGLTLDLQTFYVELVEEWYTWFLIQRAFGRRIATIVAQHIENVGDHSRHVDDRLQEIEAAWLSKSIDVDTAVFDLVKFTSQVSDTDKNNKIVDFWGGCEKVDFRFQGLKGKVQKMTERLREKNFSAMIYREQSDLTLRVDVGLLLGFLVSLFGCFRINFAVNRRSSGMTHHIPDPVKPTFRRDNFRQYITTLNIKSPDASGSLMHSAYTPTSDPPRRSGARTDQGFEHISIPMDEEEHKPIHIWKAFEKTIREFREAYDDYNTRNNIRPDGGFPTEVYKTKCEHRMSSLIRKNLGVDLGENMTSVPATLGTLLKHLGNPKTYQLALGAVVTILSDNYNARSNISGIPPLSNPPKTEESWYGWSDQFNFFISLLLASLLYDMGGKSDADGIDRLFRTEYVKYPIRKNGQEQWMTGLECRRYIYRNICYMLLQDIFTDGGNTGTPTKPDAYTIEDILSMVNSAFDFNSDDPTKSYYPTMQQYSNERFEWKRDGYETLTNDKNIVEHTLCVILVLVGVNNLTGSTTYGGLLPPDPDQRKPALDPLTSPKTPDPDTDPTTGTTPPGPPSPVGSYITPPTSPSTTPGAPRKQPEDWRSRIPAWFRTPS